MTAEEKGVGVGLDVLDCGHGGLPSPTRVCAHLIGADEPNYYRLLTGRGIENDLVCGRIVMTLDRGEYHNEQTRFPCVFAELDGRTILVAATDWNWLDAFDPTTGQCLTPRQMAKRTREHLPQHYFDYFYGSLLVSPNGQWLASDGWVWQPFGVPIVWDFRAWLTENAWESQDGPSLAALVQRDDWGEPLCWVGNDRIALCGIGWYDKATMLTGAMLFGRCHRGPWSGFAGPEGEIWSDGRHLFAASPSGLQIWDPIAGSRLARLDLKVDRYHPERLATVRRWRVREARADGDGCSGGAAQSDGELDTARTAP